MHREVMLMHCNPCLPCIRASTVCMVSTLHLLGNKGTEAERRVSGNLDLHPVAPLTCTGVFN